MIKKNFISIIVIIFIVLTVIYLEGAKKMWQKESKVIFWDVKSYYAYLPAIIIHGDPLLTFVNENPAEYGNRFWPKKAENGNNVIIMSMGLSILNLPFFLVAHFTAYIFGFETDGYSNPYLFFLLISSLFYLTFGLIFLRKILLNFFSDKITAFTIAAVFFGTNLLWYSIFEATMTHAYSFFLFTGFIFLTLKWYQNPNYKNSILIGIIFGFITLVRPTNSVIVLFFLLFNIKSLDDLVERLKLFLKNYKFIIIITIFSFLVMLPQLFYWKHVTDHWIYYSYKDGEGFFFLKPEITNGLFSYRKGWFVYTPLMLIALLSIPLLIKIEKLKSFFIPITFFVIFNIYIIFSWWCWWYGGGLGIRALIESYSLMSIPLAGFLDWTLQKKKITKIISYLIVTVLILYGTFTNIQYYYGAIHWEAMTKEAFWDSFLKAKPSAQFSGLIRTPDYDKAMLGIQAVIEPEIVEIIPNNYTFTNEIICDAEYLDKTNKLFTTENEDYFFEGVLGLSNEKAFSGKNSVKLNKTNQFGFTTSIGEVKTGDKFLISVKRFSDNKSGFLVIQTDKSEIFYQTNNQGVKVENSDWEEISILLEIPEKLNEMQIKVYCYNPDKENSFFDDLKISKLK